MITILIADDEKLERNGIKFLLKREQEELEILEAINGKDAAGILQKKQVDILFSDIKMPYMTGLELAKAARELQPEIEIVIFSGYNDFSYAKEALHYGVVDYVLKPVDPGEFHKTYCSVRDHILEKNTQKESQVLNNIKEDIQYKDSIHLRQDFQKLERKYRESMKFSEMYVKFVFSNIVKDIYEEINPGDVKALSKMIDRLYRCRKIEDVLAITEQVVCELEKFVQEQNKGFRNEVMKVKQYIHHHYAENLNVENLARQVYLSPGYLSVVFKEETGVNLNRYVRDIRMKKSRELLENTSMKISQIAKEVGFSNNSYFCRSFREYFGSTPESCRKGSMSDEEASLSVS